METQITLDRERTAKWTTLSQMRCEQKLGKPMTDMTGSATDFATIVWAALSHEDSDLTVEEVADMIDPTNIDYVNATLGKIMKKTDPLAGDGNS